MSSISEAISRKKESTPQFEYMWKVILPELNNSGARGDSSVSFRSIYDAVKDFLSSSPSVSEDISHRVYSVDIPYENFEVNKHTYASTFFYSPGTYETGSCSIKIDEYEDGKSLKYFLDWKNLIRNEDGTFNPPAVYKRDLIFIRLSTNGDELHVSKYKNCFPSEISATSFSYDANGIVQYSVTLTGDSIEHNLLSADEVKSITDKRRSEIKDEAEETWHEMW